MEEYAREEDGPGADDRVRFGETHGRYLSLVAAINGNALEDGDPAPYASWFAAALRPGPDSEAAATEA